MRYALFVLVKYKDSRIKSGFLTKILLVFLFSMQRICLSLGEDLCCLYINMDYCACFCRVISCIQILKMHVHQLKESHQNFEGQ